MNKSTLMGLLKVGGVTFAGAFAGALTLTSIPTTLDGWKMVFAPALFAAIAAELAYMKAQEYAFLQALGLLPATPATPAPGPAPTVPAAPAPATTAAVSTQPAAILARSVSSVAPPAPPVTK
jgi:hypothetical protein